MGLNEAAGYLAVAATALATGFIAARHGLRPEPFYLDVVRSPGAGADLWIMGLVVSGLGTILGGPTSSPPSSACAHPV